jgi:putative transposase
MRDIGFGSYLELLIEVVVHAASIQDRDGAKLIFAKLWRAVKDALCKLWAEGGYAGP